MRFLRPFPLAVLAGFLMPSAVLALPKLPNVNTNNVIIITSAPYNAVGNGTTDNTLAISNAIVAASSGPLTGGLIGGTVRIPSPGVFLTGPLTLRNNVNIEVDAGATLRMLPINSWTNYPAQNQTYGNLFYASGLTNIEFNGAGVIDGQGSAWWNSTGTVFSSRPYLIYFNSGCRQVLIQDITISNPPAQFVVFKGKGGNITVQNFTERAPASFLNAPNASHNTDGIDLVGTNILVQNCTISVGDDNLAFGTSSAGTPSADMTITNCAFGDGHGVSIGSNTAGGVSNLTVINCTFNGTEYGIRMKSDDNPSGGSGQGGVAQNLFYLNIGMTNIVRCPIVIYSYYSEYGTPTNITPFMASTQAVDVTTVPIWRNITISNLTATLASGGGPAGIIWGRIEVPATNVLLSRLNITATRSFDVYNTRALQLVDSHITVPGDDALALFNAGMTVSNSVAGNPPVRITGLTSANTLALYNQDASTTASDVLGATPITLSNATLTVSNNLSLTPGATVNFAVGATPAKIAATGGMGTDATVNITAAPGFGPGTFPLFSYSSTLIGSPTLGATPVTGHAYLYNLDIGTVGQVNFVVSTPPPPTFSGLTMTSGTTVVANGFGGTTNFSYYILTSTNAALPGSQWTLLGTNQFFPNGNFSFTNVITDGSPQRFYRLQYP